MIDTPPPLPGVLPATDVLDPRRCDIFLSYRRQGGAELARFIAEKLTVRGYHVFLDVDKLGAGSWSDELQRRVDECRDFVAIVTDEYMQRCIDADSVVYREVGQALKRRVNVVPLLVAKDPFPAGLVENPVTRGLQDNNGVRYYHEYPDPVIETLCTRLASTPIRGPERLQTAELEAKLVVSTVAFLAGAWQGSWFSEQITYFNVYSAFTSGLFWGIVLPIGIGIPWFIASAFVSRALKIRGDRLYGGPWIPFWAVFLPTTFVLASVACALILGTLRVDSFFWGGLCGGLTGVALAAAVIKSDAWSVVGRMLGLTSK